MFNPITDYPEFWLVVGGFIQALRLVRSFKDFLLYLSAIVFSLIAFFPAREGANYNLGLHLGVYLVFFIWFVFSVLRKHYLQKMNEVGLAFATLLFWIVTFDFPYIYYIPLFVLLGTVFTIVIVKSVNSKEDLSPSSRILLYIWYQFAGLVFVFYQFSQGGGGHGIFTNLSLLDIPELIFSGMITFGVGLQVVSILYLLPIGSGYGSAREREDEIRVYKNEIVESFTNTQAEWKSIGLFSLIFIVIYLVNRFKGYLNSALLVNIFYLTIPFISSEKMINNLRRIII